MTNLPACLLRQAAGRARTATRIGLMDLVYNMGRLVQIDGLRVSGV